MLNKKARRRENLAEALNSWVLGEKKKEKGNKGKEKEEKVENAKT